MEASLEAPFFSVVIPTYARPKALTACLEAVAQIDYPRDRFEVIVVNDGDPNLSYATIAPYEELINVRLLSQKNMGQASARNTGACNAVGEFLAFIDDSCQPSEDWLLKLSEQCSRYQNYAVGGDVINALTGNIFSVADQLYGDAVYAYFNQQPDQSTFLAARNFAVPRGLYQQLGGFDTSFLLAAGEEREFCDRWLREGHSMVYIPEAQVYHTQALNLRQFLKQHFNYGRGNWLFHQTRTRDKTVEPVKIDPMFYGHLLTYPFYKAPLHQACLLCILFFAGNVAKTVGFFWEKMRSQSPYSPSLSTIEAREL